jgi:hypothetical protein
MSAPEVCLNELLELLIDRQRKTLGCNQNAKAVLFWNDVLQTVLDIRTCMTQKCDGLARLHLYKLSAMDSSRQFRILKGSDAYILPPEVFKDRFLQCLFRLQVALLAESSTE